MRKRVLFCIAVGGTSVLLPEVALASTRGEFIAVPDWLRLGVSLVGLAVATLLLIEALGLRKVALGGAIADKISYVVLAIICLAASALVEWVQNFTFAMAAEYIRFGSQLLVIAAMALFAAYFYSVRKALQGYLRAMTGSESIANQPPEESEEDDRLA